MLTGKAEKQFEEWFSNRDKWYPPGLHSEQLTLFYKLPFEFQWGVYLEWADSLGYWIVQSYWDNDSYYYEIHDKEKMVASGSGFITGKEAQQEAIKKLNELINKE